jgi:soluble lytic murein transglycosylase-like protein
VKIALLATVLALPFVARADCYDDAAAKQGINPWLLRAIVAKESGFRSGLVTQNRNRTDDHGEGGINSVHLPELAKYGWTRDHLLDTCKNLQVTAWLLAKKIAKYGNTWKAVGAYHSETPVFRDRYAQDIQRILQHWSRQYAVQ